MNLDEQVKTSKLFKTEPTKSYSMTNLKFSDMFKRIEQQPNGLYNVKRDDLFRLAEIHEPTMFTDFWFHSLNFNNNSNYSIVSIHEDSFDLKYNGIYPNYYIYVARNENIKFNDDSMFNNFVKYVNTYLNNIATIYKCLHIKLLSLQDVDSILIPNIYHDEGLIYSVSNTSNLIITKYDKKVIDSIITVK